MCGRKACALAPDCIRKACRFRDKQGKQHQPAWRDAPNGKGFHPSYNIAPGAYTPVLLSSKHFPDGECESPRVIQPMMWGLIPSWHKGQASDKVYETNNCRSEGMLEKATYKVPLQKGRRCVVLAEGFYEWKREKSSKQPYYIYFPQTSDVKIKGEPTEVKCEPKVKQEVSGEPKVKQEVSGEPQVKQEVSGEPQVKQDVQAEQDVEQKVEEKPKEVQQEAQNVKEETTEGDKAEKGPRLLTMAGVFDVWKPNSHSEPVYSYSVITVPSSPAMSEIHHRMPAILSNDDEIEQWLNFGDVPLNKAVSVIRPVTCIEMHPVSTVVNNSRNNTPDCVKKIDLSKPKKSLGNTLLKAWLSKHQESKAEESPEKKTLMAQPSQHKEVETEEPPAKKIRRSLSQDQLSSEDKDQMTSSLEITSSQVFEDQKASSIEDIDEIISSQEDIMDGISSSQEDIIDKIISSQQDINKNITSEEDKNKMISSQVPVFQYGGSSSQEDLERLISSLDQDERTTTQEYLEKIISSVEGQEERTTTQEDLERIISSVEDQEERSTQEDLERIISSIEDQEEETSRQEDDRINPSQNPDKRPSRQVDEDQTTSSQVLQGRTSGLDDQA
ncbi:abasic site processing protein HMCES-like isoform X2 [Mya arenaria]|uniref:abasic site processing protein HMCES-like isoform X2 n=1 Tax=Mya arenaria TaxID=6604 RepID=UPI0022E7E432|nr:abasic site processing protein HMCES-like isoform X2 [Mya arenaria]